MNNEIRIADLEQEIDDLKPFVAAAKRWCQLRQEISDFRHPTTHVEEFTNLSHRHMLAENAMRDAYRRLVAQREGKE